jgi:transcriptional regulator with XRE-family HTH domain
LTQIEMATSLGLNQATISRMERSGTIEPVVLIAICSVHKVSRTWLERGEGPMLEAPEAPAALTESEVLRAYREDIERLHRRIEALTREVSRMGNEMARAKVREIGEGLRKPPPARNRVAEPGDER